MLSICKKIPLLISGCKKWICSRDWGFLFSRIFTHEKIYDLLHFGFFIEENQLVYL